MQVELNFENATFNGSDYNHDRDHHRLGNQLEKIYNLMKDGGFRTLQEISTVTGEPPASISAQLRHLRKERFGKNTINKHYLGEGLYSYQLILNKDAL